MVQPCEETSLTVPPFLRSSVPLVYDKLKPSASFSLCQLLNNENSSQYITVTFLFVCLFRLRWIPVTEKRGKEAEKY